MKHLKLAIVIAFVTVLAGLVIWNIMWMKEVGVKYEFDRLPEMANQTTEFRYKETRHVDEKPVFVEKSQSLKKQSGKILQKEDIPDKETILSSEEKANGNNNYLNQEYIDVKDNNTISITLKNKKPVRSNNRSPQQGKAPNIEIENNANHPTSTLN